MLYVSSESEPADTMAAQLNEKISSCRIAKKLFKSSPCIVFPIKSFHSSIFHKCSHISKTKGARDKRHTFLESASLSASRVLLSKSIEF